MSGECEQLWVAGCSRGNVGWRQRETRLEPGQGQLLESCTVFGRSAAEPRLGEGRQHHTRALEGSLGARGDGAGAAEVPARNRLHLRTVQSRADER